MGEPIQKRYKILIVDDERDNLEGFLRVFGDSFNLVAANSGREALEVLKNNGSIGVVVTDQRMEGMTGVDLLEAIKSMYPEVVRVLITGYSDIKVTVDAINKGDVYRYIQKPVEKKSTIEILSDSLARHTETLHIRQSIENTKKMIQQRFLQIYESVAAGIAHHINNGLTPAKTFVSLMDQKVKALKEGKYDESFFEGFLRQVIADLKRVENLVQMFLWVRNCRVEQFSKAKVSDLVVLEDEEAKEVFEKKKIRLEKNFDEGMPPAIVDRMKVEELFSLLLKNCAAASPEGSTIQVHSTETVNLDGLSFARVKITHPGRGYAPDEVPRLFDPFYKFEEKLAMGINGLELTNCFIIALKHGSEIKVSSHPGKETTFIVDLPTVKLG